MRIRSTQARDAARRLLGPRLLVMGYDAFVSYSHAADGQLAPALQLGLQRLARPWYRPRASAIFRDETGLAVSPHLWASIVRALDDSEWFVVLCSPEAAESEWVEREIKHWLAHKAPDRILLVLTDGDLVWDRERGDFDPARSTALPPALVGRFGDEPRHLDLRWARGEEQLDVRHVRFRAAVAELAAPIRNMAREELEAEDVRQHRRTMRLARGATTVLVLLLVIALTATLVAVQQRRDAQRASATAQQASATARRAAARARAETRRAEAERRRAEAEAATLLSRQLAAGALNAFAGGQRDVGLVLAVAAFRLQSTPQARSAVLTGLLAQPTLRQYLYGVGGFPQTVQYSPDGSVLAVGTADGVRCWHVTTGHQFAHQPKAVDTGGYVQQLAFRPDGKVVAVWGAKGVRLVDVATGRLVATQLTSAAAEHQAFPNQGALAWSPDGSTLAIADTTFTPLPTPTERITLFNVTTSQPVQSINTAAPLGPVALAFSPDGSLLASENSRGSVSNSVGEIQLYDVRTGAPDGPTLQSHNGFISAFRLTFGANDTLASVALGQANPSINVWNVRSRTSTVQRALPAALSGNTSPIGIVVAASPDTKLLASRSGSDGNVQLWNSQTGVALGASMATSPLLGMPSQLATASFSPDGKTLAVAADDSKIRIFSSGDPEPVLAQRVSGPPAKAVPPGADNFARLGCNSPPGASAFSRNGPATFSSDGSMYAFACRSFTGNLIGGALDLWDARSGAERPHWPVSINSDFPNGLAFSPDNKTVAVTGDLDHSGQGAVQLWDIASGHTLDKQPPIQTGDVGAVTFASDGDTIAWTDQGRVVLWDVVHGKQRGVLSPAEGATALAFSSDGKTLASANTQGVSIWDLASGSQIGTPLTTTDAETLLAAGAETAVSFDKQGDALTEVVQPFSKFTLLDAGAPFAVRWTLQAETWVNDACQIANRNLTTAEWAQYAPGIPYHKTCPAAP